MKKALLIALSATVAANTAMAQYQTSSYYGSSYNSGYTNYSNPLYNVPVISKLKALVDVAWSHGMLNGWYLNTQTESILQNYVNTGSAQLDGYVKTLITKLATDLNRGRLVPSSVSPVDIRVEQKKFIYAGAVQSYINGQISAQNLVDMVTPKNKMYRDALAVYQKLIRMRSNNQWTEASVTTMPSLSMGSKSAVAVAFLRKKLSERGYYNNTYSSAFDAELKQVVAAFQTDHKLGADGSVGPKTWSVLNKPLNDLLWQAVLGLERARWYTNDSSSEFIFVNTAQQKMEYYKNGYLDLESKTVNGKLEISDNGNKTWHTPMLSTVVTGVVMNPTWGVPPSIFKFKELPQLQTDPMFTISKRIVIYDTFNGNAVVDQSSVDWSQDPEMLSKRYLLVQQPGKDNSLGRIKFDLKNTSAIYMHDTDVRDLFDNSIRLFSSGCVRLERPFDLAERMLIDNPLWTYENIMNFTENSAIPAEKPTTVPMKRVVPVYIFYRTVQVEDDGRILSFEDYYGIDAKMKAVISN